MTQHYEPFHQTVHERSVPHRITAGVWMWSVFDEEKALNFNGYLVQTGAEEAVMIDPVCDPLDPQAVLHAFEPLPRVKAIWLTNRDHERASGFFRQNLGVPVYAPEPDGTLFEAAPDRTYRDGETLDGEWQVIHLPDQKSPGESAFYHAGRKLLILGDALIGKPLRFLSLLPEDKYRDIRKAREGLQRLAGLEVEAVLPCDGEPVFYDAQNILRDTIRLPD